MTEVLKIPLVIAGVLGVVVILQIAALSTYGWGIETIRMDLGPAGDIEIKNSLGVTQFHEVTSGSADTEHVDEFYKYTDSRCKDVNFCDDKDAKAAQGALALTLLSLFTALGSAGCCVLFAKGKIAMGLPALIGCGFTFLLQLLGCIVHSAAKAKPADIKDYYTLVGNDQITIEVGASFIVALMASFTALAAAIVMFREKRKASYQSL
eukprot:ANDGO_06596.mRNA.1 hypothetical protein